MIQDHPLKVHMPLAGQFYLLNWWTYNERGNIILARSYSSLLKTAKSVINTYFMDDFKIQDYSLVEMVSPPEEWCEQAKLKQFEEKVKIFFGRAVWQIKYYLVEKGLPLPSLLVECQAKPELEPDDYCDCGECECKLKLKNMNIFQFYEKYHNIFNEYFPEESGKIVERTVYSKAPIAKLQEEIWVAQPHFGHHSDGAVLSLTKPDNSSYFYIDSLFFCRKLQSLFNIDEIQQYLNDTISNYKEKKQIKEMSQEEIREHDLKENQEKLIKIFGS